MNERVIPAWPRYSDDDHRWDISLDGMHLLIQGAAMTFDQPLCICVPSRVIENLGQLLDVTADTGTCVVSHCAHDARFHHNEPPCSFAQPWDTYVSRSFVVKDDLPSNYCAHSVTSYRRMGDALIVETTFPTNRTQDYTHPTIRRTVCLFPESTGDPEIIFDDLSPSTEYVTSITATIRATGLIADLSTIITGYLVERGIVARLAQESAIAQ